MMGICDVSLQFLCAVAPYRCCSGLFASASSLTAPFKAHTKSKKKRSSLYLKQKFNSKPPVRAYGIHVDSNYYKAKNNGSQRLKCQCKRAEGISGITSEDNGNGSWLKDATAANGHVLSEVIGQESVGYEELHALRNEMGALSRRMISLCYLDQLSKHQRRQNHPLLKTKHGVFYKSHCALLW